MKKQNVSLEDLGLDEPAKLDSSRASQPIQAEAAPPQLPLRRPIPFTPPATEPALSYPRLRSYIAWAAWLSKQGHYLGAVMMLLSAVRNSDVLFAGGFCGLMASMVAFASANLLQIAIDAKDDLLTIAKNSRRE